MAKNTGTRTKSRKPPASHAPAGARRPQETPFPVVGIGASAGGLEAMIELLRSLPPDTGMAFVLVQHLDPTHESALTLLLSRATKMAVLEAKQNARLRPDHVYVIPPNKVMGLSRRLLKLSPRQTARQVYTPIDEFMVSLAKEEGNRAIGVLLSGSGGSDGTLGLSAIKAEGGITFAQDERTAKYSTMPANAVAAGCVDFVLSPDKIARELTRIAGHPYVAPALEEDGRALPVEDKVFQDILTLLRQRLGVDFTHYKHATLKRRIQRRMVLQKCESLADYDRYLRRHPVEVKDLFADILIHVTGFFRDPAVFQALKKRVLPRMLKGKASDDAIRIWVPGCSSGEEVYSIAMTLTEVLADRREHHPVQIFGTDINEPALERARSGIYPDRIRADVSVERLRRFFAKDEGGFRISKAIREMCVFARQNVVTDPPFSNLDLVSCRNVLIYLGPALQRKVIPLFHYALKPGGRLLLGASETIGAYADLFSLADRKAKLYAKKSVQTRPAVTFGQPAEAAASLEPAAPSFPHAEAGTHVGDIQKQADRILLTHHTPAGVVINRQLDVLQFRGRTGLYLEHPHGEATLNLLRMAREGLAIGLRTAVTRAIRQNVHVREEGLHIRQDGQFGEVAVEVVPFQVPPARERFYLVLFAEVPAPSGAPGRDSAKRGEASRRKGETAQLAHVRDELATTRESLQAIIEEQDATNEELRSANEEIMSSNEELQSTNEELETAKEELQSTNEELTTLNDELESRNVELEQVNNDVHNLLASINIPIIMVGGDLRIRRFTTVAERLLNLIPGDVGRPLTDINLRVEVAGLDQLVAEVVDTLQTRELDVRDRDGHWWSVRIRPYKTTDNKIDGAVIALLDMDLLKTNMERVREGQALTEALVDAVSTPVLIMDRDLVVQQANEAFYRTFRLAPDQVLRRGLFQAADGLWDIPRLRSLLEDVLPHAGPVPAFEEGWESPSCGRRTLRFSPRRVASAGGETGMTLLAIDDVTETRG